jgi:Kef-type K+ transport system membrane component KefB
MEQLTSSPLFVIGLLLIAGYLAAWGASGLRLPRISGYLAAGIILSPSVLGVLDVELVEDFALVGELALSVIAFSIGGSLELSRVKELGRSILAITFVQGVGAVLLAGIAVGFAGTFTPQLVQSSSEVYLSTVLILGAISAATAPAATMAVVNELRARGPLTTTLLGVVALDDAFTIVLFSLAVGFSEVLLGVTVAGGTGMGMVFMEIAGALVVGGVGGLLLAFLLGRRRRPQINLVALLGAVCLVGGLSHSLGMSPLLANMAMGFTLINRKRHADSFFHQLAIVEETIYCAFFVLAGAHFNLHILNGAALMGLLLFVGRLAGKMSGATAGAILSGAPKPVTAYLGMTLLPQAGLSLGLVLQVRPILPEPVFDMALSAILVSVVINEIVSPPLVKWALIKAGESRS